MPMLLGVHDQPSDTPLGFSLDVPEEFSSLDEARNNLEYQTNGFVKTFKDIINGNTPEVLDAEMHRKFWFNQSEKWDTAFEAFLRNPATKLTTRAQQAAWALKINHRLCMMHLRHDFSTVCADDTIWDLYPQEGEDIVQFAESLLNLDERVRGPPNQRGVEFSLDMSLVGPLYAVAHKYRDPSLRRRAIALLKKANRQEGIWDSAVAARVAERLVEIEEGAVGNVTSFHDVPNWAWIHGLNVSFNKLERKGDFSYIRSTGRQNESTESFHEVIHW